MTSPNYDQIKKDHLYAHSCALNLLLYDDDPGQRVIAVGSLSEQRMIDRREHLIDLYSRMLLLEVNGSANRLNAVAAEARRRYEEGAHKKPPPEDLPADTVTVELAEAAVRIIREVGADTDPRALERLLIAVNYQTSRDVFGTFLGNPNLAGPPDDVIADLDRIDENEDDS